jgi:5,10-methylene-tetrahydrofolate dehydrogenase/methenyl tetrahydrofolate cyclohydrolase
LKHTAIFVGGSDTAAGEALLKAVRSTFFGPMRVSVMMDSNGCNTTAAAAVVAAAKHVELKGSQAVVLGGTGPVGQRVAQILASQGSAVRVASRSQQKAAAVCAAIQKKQESARVTPASSDPEDAMKALTDASILIAAGAAGVKFLDQAQWSAAGSLRVAIDLNAVPPAGLAGIEAIDKAVQRGNVTCYGAIGVGGTKMKVHKAALRTLFDANDHVLDTAEIYAIARTM